MMDAVYTKTGRLNAGNTNAGGHWTFTEGLKRTRLEERNFLIASIYSWKLSGGTKKSARTRGFPAHLSDLQAGMKMLLKRSWTCFSTILICAPFFRRSSICPA